MSQLMHSRLRDNGCQSFWHRLGAKVCRIVCFVPALPVALLVILMLGVGVGRAQTPITYETTPRDTLGETLWTIDLSGPMTPSLDGTKFLVVNSADGLCYIVDVASGSFRRLNAIGPMSIYVPSSDLQYLAVNIRRRNENNEFVRKTSIIDMEADSIVLELPEHPTVAMWTVSKAYERLQLGNAILNIRTGDTVAVLPPAVESPCWFDDAHGLLYRSRNVGVDEYDAVTGRFIRSHGPFWNAEATVARRAPGSPWLYVVTTRMRDGYAPYVVAIHTETKEQRYFDAFAGSGMSQLGISFDMIESAYTVLFSGDRLIVGGRYYSKQFPVWLFDADRGVCRTLLMPQFKLLGETAALPCLFTPDLSACTHNEATNNGEGPELLRHRRVVPRPSVSVGGDTGLVIPSWFRQWPDRIAVVMPAGTVDECVVVGSDGREAVRVPQGRLQASPIELPTLGLASGMYVCRVRTAGEWRSQSFMVVK